MTLAERISHVGGRVTEDGCIEFGSAMALDALIQHVIRDARAAAANETGAEGVDLADFTALIDDYQCAQKDGTHDERAKARIALLNAYRAAIGRSPAMAAEAVAIPAGWKAMPPSATTAMRMAMAKAAAEYMQRTGGNSPDAIYEAGFAAAPQPAQADARIDVEALLRACVPGGDICDPQRIADSIREWFDDHGAQADARDYAMGHRDGWNECLEAQASQADARVGLTGEQREAIEHAASCLDLSELSAERELAHELRVIASRVAQPHPKCHGCPINPTCPSTTCGVSQPEPRAEVTSVQWWLAELDQYGNPKLSDGAHSERAGADKAMYLIKNLGLDNKGKRWAVARVELSEPQPSADGVNHDAVSACRTMVDATRAGGA